MTCPNVGTPCISYLTMGLLQAPTECFLVMGAMVMVVVMGAAASGAVHILLTHRYMHDWVQLVEN